MKTIGKQTLLTALVAILMALNISLVTFMWFNQHHAGPPEGPDTTKFLINELGFDKTQEQQYIALQHQLADSLKPVHENERKIHDRFFEMMHEEAPDSALVTATIDSMGHMRTQIEYFTFQHFRQVRALCNTEQKKKFDNIISEAMRRMGPRPPRRNDDMHDGPPPQPGAPER